jgi:hypothetical protein
LHEPHGKSLTDNETPFYSQRNGSQRKLSLSEKLSASPEFLLIDKQIDESFLANVISISFGRLEIGVVSFLFVLSLLVISNLTKTKVKNDL